MHAAASAKRTMRAGKAADQLIIFADDEKCLDEGLGFVNLVLLE